MNDVSYNTWIKSICVIKLDGAAITLAISSEFHKAIVKERYLKDIKSAILNVTGREYKIEISVVKISENKSGIYFIDTANMNKFINNMINSISNDTNDLFNSEFCNSDVLIFDDRQDINGEKLESVFEVSAEFQLTRPDLNTKIEILKNMVSKEELLFIDDDTIIIAENVDTNVRELIGAYNKVVSYSKMFGKKIDKQKILSII
ncbi:hypothetical protein KTC96_14495 [Clostridium estertheticum]|nr:DnaA/Hda family protein [Clostridium estertheticum]MBX4258794.1 hypothetical protein [Clostridium estertheticum]WLC69196.1 hypothetical protein KTC96_14495 [Clostridium estertheticum]